MGQWDIHEPASSEETDKDCYKKKKKDVNRTICLHFMQDNSELQDGK